MQIGCRCGAGYRASPTFLAVCTSDFICGPYPIFKLHSVPSSVAEVATLVPSCSLVGGEGPCLGKKVFACLAVSPQEGGRAERAREQGLEQSTSLGDGCPSPLPQGRRGRGFPHVHMGLGRGPAGLWPRAPASHALT